MIINQNPLITNAILLDKVQALEARYQNINPNWPLGFESIYYIAKMEILSQNLIQNIQLITEPPLDEYASRFILLKSKIFRKLFKKIFRFIFFYQQKANQTLVEYTLCNQVILAIFREKILEQHAKISQN